MRINNIQPVIYKPITFTNKDKTSNPFSFQSLKADIFQRTTALIKKAQKTNFATTERDLDKLYDETFEFVLSYMPFAKELKAEKPKLIFMNDINSIASYVFTSNKIEMNSNLKKDLFACHIYNEANELIDRFIGTKKEIKRALLRLKTKKYKITKLNPKEKCLYIKSILAHELKHWSQEHILASTEGCQEPYKDKLQTVNEIITSIEEILQCAYKYKFTPKEIKEHQTKLDKAKKQYAYILNYKPKIIFDKNQKLPISISPNANKYWSLKNHMLPAALRYRNSNEKEYNSNPLEIDAFYFQFQFILFNYDEKKSTISEDTLLAMLYDCTKKGLLAIEKIEEYDYPPLLVS